MFSKNFLPRVAKFAKQPVNWQSRAFASYNIPYAKKLQNTEQQKPKKIEDFEKINRIYTHANRHEIWLSKDKEGKQFVLKNVALSEIELKRIDDALSEQAMETGQPPTMAERPTPEELRFRAEIEAFASDLVKLLAPGHTPDNVFVVTDEGQKEFFIASEFIENYKSLYSIEKEVDPDKMFFVNDDGHTMLRLSETPDIAVKIYGRIRTKLTLDVARETDDNPENIGIKIEKNPDGSVNTDIRHAIKSIDHEFCLRRNVSSISPFPEAIKIAKGQGYSVFPEMDLNHLINIKNRSQVRKESLNHISEIFLDATSIKELFFKHFSRDYGSKCKEKIKDINEGLTRKGAAYIAANTLVENRWNGTEEHADLIFKERYGKEYAKLEPTSIYILEKQYRTNTDKTEISAGTHTR